MPPGKAAGVSKKTAARSRAGATQRASRASAAAGPGKAARKTNVQHLAAARQAHRSRSVDTMKAALTAAAQVMEPRDATNTNSPNAAARTWQHAVGGYMRTVPELNASKMYVGNCLARVHLRVGRRSPDGSVEMYVPPKEPQESLPGEPTPPPAELDADDLSETIADQAAEIISEIRSKIGGQSELLRSYGEKMFGYGELYLLPEDSAAGLMFETLSTLELSKEGDGWVRQNGPGFGTENIPAGVEPIRIWRPDDQYGKLATSSVRSCLEVLEELVILTRLVRSSAISRMALSGILLIADGFDEPETDGEDASEEEHPLVTDIVLSGATAIDDPATSAAWLPYILQGPDALIDKGVKYIQFKGDDAVNVVKRREALERLAQGLDLPMETVLGHQQTTFANAAQISEDRFAVHIEPLVQMFCDACTLAILWPALAKRAGLTPEAVKESGYPDEILRAAITFDASDLVAKPDRTKDMVQIWQSDKTQMVVSLAEMRDALGLDPDGGPEPDETARRLEAVQTTRPASPAGFLAPPVGAPDTEFEEPAAAAGQPGPVPPGLDSAGVTASIFAAVQLAERIAGAADVTMERVAEKVGNKLRSKLKGAQLAEAEALAAAEAPPWELTRMLGQTTVRRLLNGDDPIAADVRTFARTVAGWAADAGQQRPAVFAQGAATALEDAITARLFSTAPPDRFTADECSALAAASAAG